MSERSLLMIPGPIEVSEAVIAASSGPPPSHLAPPVMEAFASALRQMRPVWRAGPDSQPFVIAGSGTIAMEMAVTNLVGPGDRVVLANSGFFSDRMAVMLRRRGAEVVQVVAWPGEAPDPGIVADAIAEAPTKALFATHVDTSTGVRVDAQALCAAARENGALSVFDGVCATAAERFEMEAWGADCYLTSSQKAIGLPAGLALMVASVRALEARDALAVPPPMSMDWDEWRPVMAAYEEGRPSYFSTPATTLITALDTGLREVMADGMEARFALHQRSADAFRAAWRVLGLELLPVSMDIAANTLSAIRYPEGVDSRLVLAIKERGVVVAGGLHPELKARYFRVGHMGHVLTQQSQLERTVKAVGDALVSVGHSCDVVGAIRAFRSRSENKPS